MRVSFFLPDEPDLERLRRVDPDVEIDYFKRGERMWVLQTYLRLVRAGWEAELTDRLPGDGLVLFHVKHRSDVVHQWRENCETVLVGIRADNRALRMADFEVLQNNCYTRPGSRFFIPHWPQPGILPRDPGRGAMIKAVAYRGFNSNIDPRFLSTRFQDALRARGIEWRFDSVEFSGQATDAKAVAWHDYRDIDLSFAVRPPSRTLHSNKPGTKLYNAWLGQVPALLGPERAYRELRRSDLDYIEVSTPDATLQAIDTLRAEPARYRAMVENGVRRATEFTAAAILKQWTQLLYETLPALAQEPRVQRWRGRSLTFKKYTRRFLPFLDV
ncbi:MAG TPA: hypothetical protein VKB41_17575 [Steroidobacteraceae bacterium]|nr:hypothetical protein [Steroidobacteraceae bacterium]